MLKLDLFLWIFTNSQNISSRSYIEMKFQVLLIEPKHLSYLWKELTHFFCLLRQPIQLASAVSIRGGDPLSEEGVKSVLFLSEIVAV